MHAAQLLLLLACASLANAAPMPVIRWLVHDFPPYEIASGKDKGEGIADHYREALIRHFPQYQHVVEQVSVQRREEMMRRSDQPMCAITMFKNAEREVFARFSRRPYQYLLPPRLIALPDVAKSLGAAQAGEDISLVKAVANGQHLIGLHPRRRFGSAIDSQLQQIQQRQPDALRYFQETGEASLSNLLSLLSKGRFDLTLGYTSEVEYLRRKHPELPTLTFLPIQGSGQLLPGHVSCNRTPIGEALIADVDRLDDHAQLEESVRSEYEALLTVEERRRYQKLHPGIK
ncbi:TIGR02285 family protein [Chitinimonas sp.]|uniref:TIGR02285 family protein n=1 Tax=Chitinimonas sp. TaxID=1934313 RepID=UPI0035B402BD